MALRRTTFLLLTWALLLLVAQRLVGDLAGLANPIVVLPVLVLPWLAVLVAHGPAESFAGLRDGFDPRPEDLPHPRRDVSAAVLRTVASASLAGGFLGLFSGVIQTLNTIASSGGQAHPTELIVGVGTSFVAPLYGLALRTFFYEPLAASLEARPGDFPSAGVSGAK